MGRPSRAERERIIRRTRLTSLFNLDDYATLHKDIARTGLTPLAHFTDIGLREGRETLRPHGAARVLHEVRQRHDQDAAAFLDAFEAAQSDPGLDAFAAARTVVVAVHSHANYYMHPIAGALVHALRAAGCDCHLVDERDPALATADFPIIVAPHEFFSMPGPARLRHYGFLSRAILFNTEQMPSKWFAEAQRWMFSARAVLDVSFQTAQALGDAFPALHVLPPFDDSQLEASHAAHDPSHPIFQANAKPLFDWADRRPLTARAFDLFFAGFRTPERSRLFTRNAAYLADKHCFLAYSTLPGEPIRMNAESRAIFPTNLSVARNSRIVLAMHRYAVGYFEWERMVAQGFATGACVLATPSLPSPFFKAGVHYFETISRNLDKLIRWILDTEEGARAAQAAADEARRVMVGQLTAPRVGRHVLSFLKSLETRSDVGS
ncbi:MAG: hypothetical protein EBR82_19995 [Caulobacteraceae bacterium]|nr:hypothetical protein [Caulobacteraceae bacterium]